MSSPDSLRAEIDALPGLSRQQLLDRFEKVYRRPPPLRLSTSILALAIAYRLQEQALGGLKPEIRKALLADKPIAVVPRASPGTLLIREWQGREYRVTVHSDGVEHDGH